MRAVFFVIIALTGVLTTQAQNIKTIYYSKQWEIAPKEKAVYYRNCELAKGVALTINNRWFTGKVEDFTMDGRPLMKGAYTEKGLKTGEFVLYYPSGQIQAQGNFENGFRKGTWKYFFKNGKLDREVKFNREQFEPISVYDSTGMQIIKNGTGVWHYEYEWYGMTERYIVTGKFENGKREGEWICKLSNGQVVYTENYKNDKFKSGWVTDGTKQEALLQPVENKFMLPYKFEVTENFVYAIGTIRSHYPFLSFLPDQAERTDGVQVTPMKRDTTVIPDDQKVYYAVEQPAEFPGGKAAMMKFIASTLRYPDYARRMGVEGNVFVKFIVGIDGSISEAKLVKGIHESLNTEALRIVNLFPNWIPGKQNGQAVKTQYVMPIPFKLGR